MKKNYVTAVVLAAGRGTRMGTEIAKQYLEIGGKPVLVHALEAFAASEDIDRILLVTSAGQIGYCRTEILERYQIPKVESVIAGGRERYESVWNALQYIEENPQKTESQRSLILIHDGARPFISSRIIHNTCQALETEAAVCVGMPVKDTIKIIDTEGKIKSSPLRSLVWQAQTPQGFEESLILRAFHKLMAEPVPGITDDAMVVETMTGERVKMVEGAYTNIKITTPEDLGIAELFLQQGVQ